MKEILKALFSGNLYYLKGYFIIYWAGGKNYHHFNVLGLPKGYECFNRVWEETLTRKEAWINAKFKITGTINRVNAGSNLPPLEDIE